MEARQAIPWTIQLWNSYDNISATATTAPRYAEPHAGELGVERAAAQADPKFAETASAALHLWIEPIEKALKRVLANSPVAALITTAGLARAISAGFIGLELLEGIDPIGAQSALDTLNDLATLVDAIDELGPLTRRALHAKLGKPLKLGRTRRRST